MAQSTLIVRKNSDGKVISIKASGKFAKEIFNSLKPVTVETSEVKKEQN